ncbi:MAG: N-acetylmuramoyl-L-alanine amidase [Acidobacteria bacterium]|nr:N-acetylmuramoyl-L-alanine amidase [Acidobacteriota bacterium]
MASRKTFLIIFLLFSTAICASTKFLEQKSSVRAYALTSRSRGIRLQLVALRGRITLKTASFWLNRKSLRRFRRKFPAKKITISYNRLNSRSKKILMVKIFPGDKFRNGKYQHKVRYRGVETYWRVSEWFTGNGANYRTLMKFNRVKSSTLKLGTWISIPKELLLPFFLPEPKTLPGIFSGKVPVKQVKVPNPNSSSSPVSAEKKTASGPTLPASGTWKLSPEARHFHLLYGKDKKGAYAIYRLAKGEALYSSVVVRFTGRLDADSVHELVRVIVKRNGIRDVTDMKVGYPVKIPLQYLLPEFLPKTSKAFKEYQEELQETEKAASETRIGRARHLDGVYLILDSGHGGRDTGAHYNNTWEDDYMYDIACRIKKIIETETKGHVIPTTFDKSSRYVPIEKRHLQMDRDEYLRTTPMFPLNSRFVTTVGVHLRWYLANYQFERLKKSGVPGTKIVFVSFHADALYHKVTGSMVYIPSAARNLFRSSIMMKNRKYKKYLEYRAHPMYRYRRRDVQVAEGLSRKFARVLISQLKAKGIPTHKEQPIRSYIFRSRRSRPFVPAVVKYTKMPLRCLIEVANLKNKRDAANVRDPKFREKYARAFVQALIQFYGGA